MVTHPPIACSEPIPATPPACILYVEDNDYVRVSVTELLQSETRSFISCGNVADALAVLRQRHIDLLITDLNLPDMPGLELVRQALRFDPECPVIICSAHDMSRATFEKGARVVCIRKPFELDELENTVDRMIECRDAV
jgi:two-component system, cell cycle response regulator CpdR